MEERFTLCCVVIREIQQPVSEHGVVWSSRYGGVERSWYKRPQEVNIKVWREAYEVKLELCLINRGVDRYIRERTRYTVEDTIDLAGTHLPDPINPPQCCMQVDPEVDNVP